MADEKKREEEQKTEGNRKFNLKNIFYHNTFTFIFSLIAAMAIWIFMASENEEVPRTIYDVPINFKYSSAASEQGLRIFSYSYDTADITVAGSTVITNNLSSADFDVSVTLNPTSTKITSGNTLQKATLPVNVEKVTAVSDYTIASVDPQEIVVEYDRYKESTFQIEENIVYSADTGFYAGQPVLSMDTVTVGGPESSVNKISRVVAEYTLQDLLNEERNISECALVLYDENNQQITDYEGMYITLSAQTVGVTIPVTPMKTVPLVCNTINGPEGFTASRILIQPESISIAAPAEVLDSLESITLPDVIDFSTLDPDVKNEFEMEIPLPIGAKDITNLGDTNVSTALVTVNLNGYGKARVTTQNITLTNVPSNIEAEIATNSLTVLLAGTEAQVSKLTGDSVSCVADLTNFAERRGVVEVPVTVSVESSDSCWSLGTYSVFVTIYEKASAAAAAFNIGNPSGGLAATPQE